MDQRKLYHFLLELRDVKGVPLYQAKCKVQILDRSGFVDVKTPLQFELYDIDPNEQVTIILQGKDQGTSKVSFATLFGEKLEGRVEKWLRLRSSEGKVLKVLISANLKKGNRGQVSSSPSRRSSRARASIACPYLEKIATGKETNQETLDQILKYRNSLPEQNQTIRISIEPNSPTKPDGDFEMPGLEEITFEKLQSYRGTQLKELVRRMCEEANQLSTITSQLPKMRETLQTKITERRNLETRTEELNNGLQAKGTSNLQAFQKLRYTRNQLEENLVSKQEENRQLELELDTLKANLCDLKREGVSLQIHSSIHQDLENEVQSTQQLENSLKLKKEHLESSVNKGREDIENLLKKAETEKGQALLESEKIQKEVNDAKLSLDQLKQKNSELKTQKEKLHQALDLENKLPTNLTESEKAFRKFSSKHEEAMSEVENILNKTKSQEKFEQHQKLLESREYHLKELNQKEKELENQHQEIHKLEKETFRLTNEQVTLEEICCVRADLSKLMEEMQNIQSIQKNSQDAILRDLRASSHYAKTKGEETFIEAQRLEKIIDSIEVHEEELTHLKDAMAEVKRRNPPYLAVETDPLDKAIGEYMNSRAEAIQIPFVREAPGRYTFGTRKVQIKFLEGKLVVRIGGGYRDIEEFLELYLPIELEKFEGKGIAKVIGENLYDMSPKRAAAAAMSAFSTIAASPTKSLTKSPTKSSTKSPTKSPKKLTRA